MDDDGFSIAMFNCQRVDDTGHTGPITGDSRDTSVSSSAKKICCPPMRCLPALGAPPGNEFANGLVLLGKF